MVTLGVGMVVYNTCVHIRHAAVITRRVDAMNAHSPQVRWQTPHL